MDAQVAYGFHHLRNEKPYLARGPISNKVNILGFLSLFSCVAVVVEMGLKFMILGLLHTGVS